MSTRWDDIFVEEVFTTKELAEKWIQQKTSWKNKFQQKFGVSYDDAPLITEEMQDWIFDNELDDESNYFILEKELHDN